MCSYATLAMVRLGNTPKVWRMCCGGTGSRWPTFARPALQSKPDFSYSYAPDEAIAMRVGRLIGIMPVRRPLPKEGLMPQPGTVELGLTS